jgi:hypothetical protein
VSDYRKPDLEKIIRIKDGKKSCPWCWGKMRYLRVEGKMELWSPGRYAWFCTGCPVTILDGSIVPNDDNWDTRIKRDEKRRLSSMLASVIRGAKKKRARDDSQAR